MTTLYIAEKPELAKALVNAIGINPKKRDGYTECDNFTVTWCFGHLFQFKNPEEINPEYKSWALDKLPMSLMPVPIKPTPKTKRQAATINSLLKTASYVINMGDDDPEGQRLIDEVIEYYNYKGKVGRILVSDLNPIAIKKAVDNIKPNSQFIAISMSALGRAVFDYIYGMNLTRVCTIVAQDSGYDGVLSVGRVQTATFGMIVKRYRANKSHIKEPFYEVFAISHHNGQQYRFKLAPSEQLLSKYGDHFDEKHRIITKQLADQLAAGITQIGQGEITVKEDKIKKVQAPLPFNLSNLQREANRLYGIPIDKTLELTQQLREQHHLITYNRTDCSYLPTDHHSFAPELLQVINRLVPEMSNVIKYTDTTIKNRAFNDKKIEAHHAIEPTASDKADLSKLTADQKRIYLLICRKYVALFLPHCEQATSHVELVVNNTFTFKAGSKAEIKKGWKAIFNQEGDITDDEDDNDDSANLGKNGNLTLLEQGQILNIDNCENKTGWTTAPSIYTLDTLLLDMNNAAKYIIDPRLRQILVDRDKDSQQNGGIGTPATQATIIKTLYDRNFIKNNKKLVIPTPIGEEFFDALPEFTTQVDLTAYWQEKMNMLAKGDMTFDQFQEQVDQFVTNAVFNVKENGLSLKSANRVHYKCPECGSKLRLFEKYKIWNCSSYPDCKAKYPDIAKRPDFNAKPKAPPEATDLDCPKCGKHKLGKRVSDKGFEWYGCSGYPQCKASFSLKDGELQVLDFSKKKKSPQKKKTSAKPATNK